MAQIKSPYAKQQERISKSRAAKASIMTVFTVVAFLVFIYLLYLALTAIHERKFGGFLVSTAVSMGLLSALAFVGVKVLLFCETRLLSNDIDADHKKYL